MAAKQSASKRPPTLTVSPEAAVQHIHRDVLAESLRKKDPTVFVYDVRSEDECACGRIPGAVFVPFHLLDEAQLAGEDKLMEFARTQFAAPLALPVATVVFHCMYSQMRAPHVAAKFANLLPKLGKTPEELQVRILIEGFHGWINAFHQKEPALLEGVDPSMWQDLPEVGLVLTADVPFCAQ